MKARLIRTCTGPRPLDGVGGRLRRLRWCGHFIADLAHSPSQRVAVVTANGRSLPALTCPIVRDVEGAKHRREWRHRPDHGYAPNPTSLLRVRRERPRRRAAEQRDELAPVAHSITSSARCCKNKGTSRPSALAVLRLITSSNLTGIWTGSSLGFSPLRMRSTYDAVRR
jgi:hypothetical protein